MKTICIGRADAMEGRNKEENKMNMEWNQRLDKETLIICAMMALVAAIGIVASFGVVTGVRVLEVNILATFCSMLGLAGIIWSILIIRLLTRK